MPRKICEKCHKNLATVSDRERFGRPIVTIVGYDTVWKKVIGLFGFLVIFKQKDTKS